MNSRRVSRAWGLGAIATGALLTMASTAFACTIYAGKATVTATGPGALGSASADGGGVDTDQHAYCGAHPRGNLVTAGTIRVEVGATTNCPTTKTLPAGAYNVYWVSAAPTEGVGPTNTGNLQVDGITHPEFYNCNNTIQVQNTGRQQLGTITVSSSGTGSVDVNLAGKAAPGPGNICVNDGTGDSESTSSPQVYINWI